jgi:phytoene dehydrogenase-like protein
VANDESSLPLQTIEHANHVLNRLSHRERPVEGRRFQPTLLKGRHPKVGLKLGCERIEVGKAESRSAMQQQHRRPRAHTPTGQPAIDALDRERFSPHHRLPRYLALRGFGNGWQNAGIRSALHMFGAPTESRDPVGVTAEAAADAVVVGSGPNGLAAAIELARAGRSVRVLERAATVGGGTRTAELTLPGFHHDVCSAVHPLAAGSPYLARLKLERRGLELVYPAIEAAHPLDDGTAVALRRSVAETAAGLGVDGRAYASLVEPLASEWDSLADLLLSPPHPPRDPLLATRFGISALRSAQGLARHAFTEPRARALLAGMAAHAMRPLRAPGTAAYGLVLLVLGHAVGWPIACGGSQAIPDAMLAELEALGGVVETGLEVRSLQDLPPARAILFDLSPRQLIEISGDALPGRYVRALGRYRYGPGVFKVDYALDGPVPWRAAECHHAGTVHLGGTLEEIAAGELAVSRGSHPERPYVLVAQQSVLDSTRAPAGKQTLWAYCHVPNGSDVDMSARIEAQIERFAPGFSDLILARATRGPAQVEADNPNYIGGDINGGLASLRQTVARPVASLCPYATPNPRIFICSASTPPGGGVHGMCGYHAARAALRRVLS